MNVNQKAPETIDFEKEGLMVGLEFHQQLYAPYYGENSSFLEKKHGSKLFCPCPALIREDDPDFEIERELRAVSGETGKIDVAAEFEKKKSQKIFYQGNFDTTCLVELDEEPIFPINPVALFRSIAIAKNLFNLNIFDEILVCRKTIIDGSNTSGFQRTAQIAFGGENSFITVGDKKIHIYQANLEEDSAKNVGRSEKGRYFRLDRLGIPLIEIATGPDMNSPEEVYQTAYRIGTLLRTTGFVKRGLGTIRQDINVSIKRGTRIEIKGVQNLDILPAYVKNEAIRQSRMLEFLELLKERGFTKRTVASIKAIDVTEVFRNCKAKFIANAIKKKNKVIGARMPKMDQLLGFELQPDYRIGSELSEIAKVTSSAGGILHSDELPKFGISQEEKDKVAKILNVKNGDGFILIVGSENIGRNSIDNIKRIIKIWLDSDPLPPEVRAPRPDGTTGFLRPLPGQARMYPETDAPPIHIDEKFIEKVDEIKFEMPEERLKRYIEVLKLPEDIAKQLYNHPQNSLFEEIINKTGVRPTLVATTLLQDLVDLRRKGFQTNKITEDHIMEIFRQIGEKKITKASILPILQGIAEAKKSLSPQEAVEKFSIKPIDQNEIEKVVDEIIQQNLDLVKSKGLGAMGLIIGRTMAKFQGKADGKVVSAIVKKKLS
ncbi:MAG: Glu-tRNA(Gln) amidotransferase GatDE subunit E [Methanobacteriota archaeon]|nr:MAG: Glu-tRNA(Gln) amidotransferase GatDE subunit E [Euryarchaeota archaeon]